MVCGGESLLFGRAAGAACSSRTLSRWAWTLGDGAGGHGLQAGVVAAVGIALHQGQGLVVGGFLLAQVDLVEVGRRGGVQVVDQALAALVEFDRAASCRRP